MNFKTLSKFIIILGIVIFAYGGFQYVTNRPQDVDTPTSFTGAMIGIEKAVGNVGRANRRETAIKVMVGGTIVLFIGIAVLISAKGDVS